MKPSEARRALSEAFDRLTDRELLNIQYHIERGTPVLCGKDASYFELHGGG